MAKLRKGAAYSKRYARPNTRVSKKRTKSYIKTRPQVKISKFHMGNVKGFQKDNFDTWVNVISEEEVQIRDHALEAIRQSIIRKLDKNIKDQFYFEIKIFPHHILRENKMLTGAGADRMQSGMKHSFGKTAGRAAMVKPGKILFRVATSGDKNIRIVRKTVQAVKSKLPCKTKILNEEIEKSQ
jgi:large subunit ribosomal protein L10e